MSWGGGEFAGEAGLDAHFNHPGIAFTASSGDGGAGGQLSIGLDLCDDRRRHDLVARVGRHTAGGNRVVRQRRWDFRG